MEKYIEISFDKFNTPKVWIGIVFALMSLLMCGIMFSWGIGCLIAVLFFSFSIIKIETRKAWVSILLNFFWGVGCIAFASFVSPICGAVNIGVYRMALNFLCAFFITEIVFVTSLKWRLSITISFLVLVFLSMANAFIYQFRGKELGPMDILSVGTALNVAGQYNLQVSNILVEFLLFSVVCVFSQFSIPKVRGEKIRKRHIRLTATLTTILTALTIFFAGVNIPIKTWGADGSSVNGYYLNFWLGIRNAYIKEPDGYSNETVEYLASLYKTKSDEGFGDSIPNIIVIMDESYSDFSIFREKLSTNIEVTPFIDSLSENTIRGYALSSVFGGNTANSEFEFLTSSSMGFLPENVVPYQQYITEKTYSIAWFLNHHGYTSFATHPYRANGWSRSTILPLLGFDQCTFLEDYANTGLIRNYVSDKEMFSYILERLNNKKKGPLFVFGITMQNHGGYNYEGENYEQTVFLQNYKQEFPLAEQYLSLIHQTDNAVQYLLTNLKKYHEDTIVLFFGDHLPKVETEFYEELNGGTFDTLDEQMLQYTIPFFIWANYDIPSEHIERTSINYLARYLLENANMELPPYYLALADIEETIPAINAYGYFSQQRGRYVSLEDAEGCEAEMIEKYRMIQYNNLFDQNNRNAVFFLKYIMEDKE